MLTPSAASLEAVPALANVPQPLEAIIEEEEAAAALRGVTMQTMQATTYPLPAATDSGSSMQASHESGGSTRLLDRGRHTSVDSTGRVRSASMSSAELSSRLAADTAASLATVCPAVTENDGCDERHNGRETEAKEERGGETAAQQTTDGAVLGSVAVTERAARAAQLGHGLVMEPEEDGSVAGYAATEATSAGPSTVWTMRQDDLDGRAAMGHLVHQRRAAERAERAGRATAGDDAEEDDDDDTAGSDTQSIGSSAQWQAASSALKQAAAASAAESEIHDRAVWTPEWCRRVLAVLESSKKPVLVHCQTGVAACAIGLIRAAKQLKATPRQVARWGADLGHSFSSHGDLEACISVLLADPADGAGTPSSLAEVDAEAEDAPTQS
jgi:hypothetical protein